ncbi:hypothetical protein PG993_000538 [Apiospora rasikravindrae]|uniref:Uncharacterized protein n=1 Tax=Apiospora rasikravindrae TaxID=990691 RepID=A0ABR1UAX8_9PEZI
MILYMDTVDGMLVTLGQELEELGLGGHDYHEEQQRPEEIKEKADEPKDDQLDDLFRWLESLRSPTNGRMA